MRIDLIRKSLYKLDSFITFIICRLWEYDYSIILKIRNDIIDKSILFWPKRAQISASINND